MEEEEEKGKTKKDNKKTLNNKGNEKEVEISRKKKK